MLAKQGITKNAMDKVEEELHAIMTKIKTLIMMTSTTNTLILTMTTKVLLSYKMM
jgi:hypothetical protein